MPEAHIRHHFADGVYAKETFIPKGMQLTQHVHSYDHLSMLVCGKVLLQRGDVLETVEGPKCLTIKAGIQHAVTALEDSVWYCVHATEDSDPQTVDASILGKKHG